MSLPNNKEIRIADQYGGHYSEELAQAIAEYREVLLKPFKDISDYLHNSSLLLEGSSFTLDVLITTENNINKALKEASGD